MTSNHVQSIFDGSAIGFSVVCALHCLATPVAMVLSPLLAASMGSDETFHVVSSWLVIPTSVVALRIGCRRHRVGSVFSLGVLGVALMLLLAVAGHEILGERWERLGTALASVLVATTHIRNYRLCRVAHSRGRRGHGSAP